MEDSFELEYGAGWMPSCVLESGFKISRGNNSLLQITKIELGYVQYVAHDVLRRIHRGCPSVFLTVDGTDILANLRVVTSYSKNDPIRMKRGPTA